MTQAETAQPQDEAAVVTGASSGIGEAIANALLDRESGFITGQALFVCGGTSVTGTGGA